MLRVTDAIEIDENELQFEFVRASGPGGQHVNKVSSAVQLRFDVEGSPSLPAHVKTRMRSVAGRKITADGVLIIDARSSRSQSANREEAVRRLVALVEQAAQRPKPRKRTRPTAASKRRRIQAKKRRSDLKRTRRPPRRDE